MSKQYAAKLIEYIAGVLRDNNCNIEYIRLTCEQEMLLKAEAPPSYWKYGSTFSMRKFMDKSLVLRGSILDCEYRKMKNKPPCIDITGVIADECD